MQIQISVLQLGKPCGQFGVGVLQNGWFVKNQRSSAHPVTASPLHYYRRGLCLPKIRSKRSRLKREPVLTTQNWFNPLRNSASEPTNTSSPTVPISTMEITVIPCAWLTDRNRFPFPTLLRPRNCGTPLQ